jgi:hypothetical protein
MAVPVTGAPASLPSVRELTRSAFLPRTERDRLLEA